MALVVHQVTQRGNIMLGPVFAFQLPSAIILRVLPASIELVDFLLCFGLYLLAQDETGSLICSKLIFQTKLLNARNDLISILKLPSEDSERIKEFC